MNNQKCIKLINKYLKIENELNNLESIDPENFERLSKEIETTIKNETEKIQYLILALKEVMPVPNKKFKQMF